MGVGRNFAFLTSSQIHPAGSGITLQEQEAGIGVLLLELSTASPHELQGRSSQEALLLF